MNFTLGFILRIIGAALMLTGFIDDLGGNLDPVDNPDLNEMMNHVGLLGLHGNFYFMQKVFITAICLYMVLSALELHKNAWILGYVAVLIIYNPVFPMDMDRMLWLVADLFCGLFIIVSLFTFVNPGGKKSDPRKMKLPYLNKPPRF